MHSIAAFFKQTYNRIEWRTALKTGLAASISYIIGVAISKILDRPDTLVSGLWCVLTAIVVSQANIGLTYKTAWIRFLGVIVGSIMGGYITTYLGSDSVSLGIGVFFTVIICSILNIKDSFRIACMSVAVVMLLWGFKHAVSPWTFSFFRFIDSCIGIITTLAVAHFILPEKAITNLEKNVINLLLSLGKYYRLALDTERESPEIDENSQELFIEIDELLSENRTLLEESKIESIARRPSFPEEWTLISYQLGSLFETIDSLRHVQKGTLSKIFDDALDNQVKSVIDKTDLTFEELTKLISTKKRAGAHMEELKKALQGLNSEQIRFRDTRTTRKFNLAEVESFFVFFYSLRFIGEELIKMEERLITIYQITG